MEGERLIRSASAPEEKILISLLHRLVRFQHSPETQMLLQSPFNNSLTTGNLNCAGSVTVSSETGPHGIREALKSKCLEALIYRVYRGYDSLVVHKSKNF